jgi:glycosyltransferase involved in cell wall biosynthesis
MRILHCILSTEYAGSEAYMCQLASMQANHGDDVLVVVRDAGAAYVARVAKEAAPAPVVTIPGWVPAFLQRFAVRAMITGFEPEIMHAHLGRAVKRAGAAARGAGVPVVASLHLNWRKDYALCDGVICIADWQRKGIPAGYKGKVATVWNWVAQGDAPKVKPEKGVTRFGSVGRLVHNKGMDILVRAFRKAFPKGDEKVRLTIVGEGPEWEELERLAAGDARIALAGYREDTANAYAGMDVYVSAARYEPFGLTILEAMRAGCRLVCTRTDGPREFLKQYSINWAEPDDVESLAKALKAGAKSKGAVPWDLAPFSPKRALKQIKAFYQSVL